MSSAGEGWGENEGLEASYGGNVEPLCYSVVADVVGVPSDLDRPSRLERLGIDELQRASSAVPIATDPSSAATAMPCGS